MRLAIRWAAATLLWAASAGSPAQDYDREKRWADEVAPGVVVGDVAWIEASSGRRFLALYATGRAGRPAMLIVHGIGVHPDHGIIGVLRSRLADAGYATLSIQMPVLAADKRGDDYYPKVFPDARDRIARATEWLRARGHARIVLVSHSMGSWMVNDYFDATPDAPHAAWVCLGLTGGYSWGTYFGARPILDIYGEHDLPPSLEAAWRRRLALSTTHAASRQVMIPGADHFYAQREAELAAEIDRFVAALPG